MLNIRKIKIKFTNANSCRMMYGVILNSKLREVVFLLHFIVNPVAGRVGCEKLFERLKPILEACRTQYTVAVSDCPGGVAPLAKAAVEAGASGVVVVGGDGTVTEAARVLAGTGIPLGIIPGGTGNDLAVTLGISREAEAALYVVLKGFSREMDAGSINGQFFVNVAGTGFDVLVAKNVAKFKRVLTGLAGYGAAVILSILKTKPKHIKYETEEGVFERDVLLIAVANGRYYGGGMQVAPLANPYDGLLDICVVNSVPRWKIPVLLSRFVKGRHLIFPFTEYFKTPWIKLESEPDTVFNLDGEIGGAVPADIRLHKGAIRVFVEEN